MLHVPSRFNVVVFFSCRSHKVLMGIGFFSIIFERICFSFAVFIFNVIYIKERKFFQQTLQNTKTKRVRAEKCTKIHKITCIFIETAPEEMWIFCCSYFGLFRLLDIYFDSRVSFWTWSLWASLICFKTKLVFVLAVYILFLLLLVDFFFFWAMWIEPPRTVWVVMVVVFFPPLYVSEYNKPNQTVNSWF